MNTHYRVRFGLIAPETIAAQFSFFSIDRQYRTVKTRLTGLPASRNGFPVYTPKISKEVYIAPQNCGIMS